MPFTPPTACYRCGSDSVIPDVRPDAHDSGDADRAQCLVIATKPGNAVFKDYVRVWSTAFVCADCGAVETYAVAPEALWQAHLERIANGWTP